MEKVAKYNMTFVIYAVYLAIGILVNVFVIFGISGGNIIGEDGFYIPYTGVTDIDMVLTLFDTILLAALIPLAILATYNTFLGKLPKKYFLPPLSETFIMLQTFFFNNPQPSVNLLGVWFGFDEFVIVALRTLQIFIYAFFMWSLFVLYQTSKVTKK